MMLPASFRKTTILFMDYHSLYFIQFLWNHQCNVCSIMDQTEYIDRGFLLDMQFIDKFVFQPFKETTTDLLKLRESDAQSIDMMETCGLVCRNNDTHFVFVVKA